jgi:hypothetical protein
VHHPGRHRREPPGAHQPLHLADLLDLLAVDAQRHRLEPR